MYMYIYIYTQIFIYIYTYRFNTYILIFTQLDRPIYLPTMCHILLTSMRDVTHINTSQNTYQ